LSAQSRGRSPGTFRLISRDFVSSCGIPTLTLVFSPRPATAVPEPPRQKVGPPQTKGRSFTGMNIEKELTACACGETLTPVERPMGCCSDCIRNQRLSGRNGKSADHDPEHLQGSGGGLRLRALSEVEPRQVQWLVPGMIPLRALTLVAGIGGLGKS